MLGFLSENFVIIAFLAIIAAACVWVFIQVKNIGKTENKLEVAENEAKILKAQRDNNVTNVDDAIRVLTKRKRK